MLQMAPVEPAVGSREILSGRIFTAVFLVLGPEWMEDVFGRLLSLQRQTRAMMTGMTTGTAAEAATTT